MAMEVDSRPPALVVRAPTPKKASLSEHGNMCDRMWACLLDDYLDVDDDASHPSLLDTENSENVRGSKDRLEAKGKKSKKSKKKKKKDKSRKKKVEAAKTLLGSIPDDDNNNIDNDNDDKKQDSFPVDGTTNLEPDWEEPDWEGQKMPKKSMKATQRNNYVFGEDPEAEIGGEKLEPAIHDRNDSDAGVVLELLNDDSDERMFEKNGRTPVLEDRGAASASTIAERSNVGPAHIDTTRGSYTENGSIEDLATLHRDEKWHGRADLLGHRSLTLPSSSPSSHRRNQQKRVEYSSPEDIRRHLGLTKSLGEGDRDILTSRYGAVDSRNDDGESVWALEDSKRSKLDDIRQKKLHRKEALEKIRHLRQSLSNAHH